MSTDETALLEGPEMDALRDLRADVPGPTAAQRQAAWERVQGARSQAGATRPKGGRGWLLAGAAAVAAGVIAGGIALAVNNGEEQPAPPATTSAPTNPNPSPFATGSVWDSAGAEEKKVVDTYRAENIHLTLEGGVRIDIPEELNWEAMNKATNAEGIPIRFWAVEGERGTWDTQAAMPIDGEDGIDMAGQPGPTYPRDKVTESRVAGPDSALESLTFDEIPTEPVDIAFTQ